MSRTFFICTALLAAIGWSSTAPAVDPTGTALEPNQTVVFEGYPAIRNQWGELQVQSLARLAARRGEGLVLRSEFRSAQGRSLALVGQAFDSGKASLSISLGSSVIGLEVAPDRQPVLSGLLKPRSERALKQMMESGVPVDSLAYFLEPAIEWQDWELFQEFAAFLRTAEADLELSSPAERDDILNDEWARICDLALETLGEDEKLGLSSEILMSNALSCIGNAILAASGNLALWNTRLDCLMCAVSKRPTYCNPCAAAIGVAAGSLMTAVTECFGDSPPDPDNPPPPPGAGNLPAPIHMPPNQVLVPIYSLETVTICVDGTCYQQTVVTIIGWQLIER